MKYPAIARENDIQGTVVVQFVVAKDGDITKVNVVRGIGGGCDEEAVRVVKSMPNWKSGKHNGKAVPVNFTLPIKFKLEG
ncbi:MAG: energy transducer TonB [Saprospiraceae bacterium]|nr:energy transducer TonB [Saprospiraceae bacterium]